MTRNTNAIGQLFNDALQLHQRGKIRDAIRIYEKLLPSMQKNAELLYVLGTANLQIKQFERGIEQIRRSLVLNPGNAAAHNNLGNALIELKRLDEALASYDKALAIKPDYAEAYNNRGNALKELNRLDEALASYDKALTLRPDHTGAHNNRGIVLKDLQRPNEALVSFDKALTLKPDYADAYNNRGNALRDLKRLDEALASLDKALTLNPEHVQAYNNRGNVLHDLKRLDEALASFDKALALKPDYAEAYNNRGNALRDLKRLDAALTSFDKALTLKPDYAGAYNNRGNTLRDLNRLDEALVAYDQALTLNPEYAEAYNNRGYALKDLNRLDAALASYDKALTLNPDYAEAYNNRGNALLDLKRFEEALESYDKALMLKPDYAEPYNNRGYVLQQLVRLDEALASFDKALRLRPDFKFLLGSFLHTKMQLCDWDSVNENLDQLVEAVSQSKPATMPFPLLGLIDSPELQLNTAQIHVTTKYPRRDVLGPFRKRPADGKIRVGYYSADFHNHATAFLMAELFEAHDRSNFEFFAFSFGPDSKDDMRRRVSSAFDQFIDVRDKSDREVAQLSRELDIDIAVDLKGYTQDCRTGIFAERAAPIQVNYLGYPGTMGAEYIDYVIADKTIVTPESRPYYTEKVVYLPHSYQANDSKRKISGRRFAKQDFGLPETGFVFCCFNKSYKILPAIFDRWMRILKAIEGSHLWLFEQCSTTATNLRKEAETRGVDSSRLVFAQHMPLDEHLARHRLADLFIDTLPCNAHTTASDALWAGLPVLTCLGRSFASRVSASLLNAIELPELITCTPEEYEAKAIELASHPDKLGEIKAKLQRNRLTTPLFDGRLLAGHLEASYLAMFEQYRRGCQPTDIDI
jgi:protein O-GlcNAc transferase